MKKVNIFAQTSKSNGSFRMILNLKSWMIICHIFTLKWKPLNLNLVVPNSDMAKIDIKNALHNILSRFYLNTKSFWNLVCNESLIYLHNRLCSGPRKLTKLLKTPLAELRLDNIKIAVFIDDLITLAYSLDICFKNVWKCVKRLGNLTFVAIQKNHFLLHLRKLNTCGL